MRLASWALLAALSGPALAQTDPAANLQPVPARLPEGPLSCGDATSRAMSADLKAAQSGQAALDVLIALQEASLTQWRVAVSRCDGKARERAQRLLSDNERARQRLAEREQAGAQCELTMRDAGSLQDLAKAAFTERRWPDAGALYRKAETLWDLAAEHCTGDQQQSASQRRVEAEIDAHNAEECAPGFDRARELSGRLRTLGPSAQPAERERASQAAETLWRGAVDTCRGPAKDLAKANAEAVARERGTPWVNTAAPREDRPVVPARGSGFATVVEPDPPPPPAVTAKAAVAESPALAGAAAAKVANATDDSPGLLQRAGSAVGMAVKAARDVVGAVVSAAPAVMATAAATTAAATAAATATASATSSATAATTAAAASVAAPVVKALAGQAIEAGSGAATAAKTATSAAGELSETLPKLPDADVELQAANARYKGRFALDAERRVGGEGLVEWEHGERYEGRMLAGKRHGKGRFTWSNGQQFEGDWADDQPQGLGRLRFANGDVYEGYVKDGRPEGLGEMRYLRGDQFRGLFRNGSPNGRGLYRWANGQSFEGDWIGLTPQGKGLLRFANGDVYEGEVRDGTPEGHGRMRYFNGGDYEGGFKAGLSHGLGRYVWPGGDRYEGAWVDGKKHGQGTFYFASGERWVGRFENDERSDDGVFHGNAK